MRSAGSPGKKRFHAVPKMYHMSPDVAVDDDEWIADQERFAERRPEHGACTHPGECQPVVAHDEADGRFDGHRDPPAPATRVPVDRPTVPDDVHRKDPVLIERSETAQRDDRPLRDTKHARELLVEVDENDVAQILPGRLIDFASREVHANEIVEDERLRRLGKLLARRRKAML